MFVLNSRQTRCTKNSLLRSRVHHYPYNPLAVRKSSDILLFQARPFAERQIGMLLAFMWKTVHEKHGRSLAGPSR